MGERQLCTQRQRLFEGDATGDSIIRHHFSHIFHHQIHNQRFGESQQIAQLGGNNLLNIGIWQNLLQGCTEIIHHQNDLRPRILKLMTQLSWGVKGIGIDDGKPGS